jgi:glucosamine--fructose-6-phosphate aminotransferase (isomerizing)
MRQCVVPSRGRNVANAYELALKLMETCYGVAQRFFSADFARRPVALIERDFSAIILMPPGKVFSDLKKLAERLRKWRAGTLLISATGVRLPPARRTIRVPGPMPETYTPIPCIVPGQLLTVLLAEVKGLDPDKPRSLRIVTRTV